MLLEQKIRDIIGISLWQFEGLPDRITSAFDDLLTTYTCDELILAINSLAPKLQIEETKARKNAGNSGMAGEYHMAIEMQLYYLKQCLDLIREKQSTN
jgi:hypothetical protein